MLPPLISWRVRAKRIPPPVRGFSPEAAVFFLSATPGFAFAERNPDSRASINVGLMRPDAAGGRPPPGTRAACEMRSGPEPGDADRWSQRRRRIESEERGRETSRS